MGMRCRAFIIFFIVGVSFSGTASAGDFTKQFGQAVADGDVVEVVRILDRGADINTRNKEGETALMVASLEGRGEIVKLLLARGADANIMDSVGATALLYAAVGGSADIMKLLLDRGADPDAKTNDGESALSISLIKGNKAAVDVLQKAKGKHKK